MAMSKCRPEWLSKYTASIESCCLYRYLNHLKLWYVNTSWCSIFAVARIWFQMPISHAFSCLISVCIIFPFLSPGVVSDLHQMWKWSHIQHSLYQHGIFLLHDGIWNGPKVTIFISLDLCWNWCFTLCTCATQNILRILPKISYLDQWAIFLPGALWQWPERPVLGLLTLHTSTTPVIRQLLPNNIWTERLHAPPFWEETSSMMFQNNYWTIIKHKFENFCWQ